MSADAQKFCPQCQRDVLAIGNKVNHILHFLVGLFTCGGWWLVWVFLILVSQGHKCSNCGNPRLAPPRGLIHPQPPQYPYMRPPGM